ncbi:hypothetical protein [Zavarzinella formosa]|uniref:hypothetical protein n=1 Tax=Zavarzinella formosa TaxID=360055 RepID=UPI0002FA81AC|nr:hypothetical protein [Zavarzinella formosa]
MIRFLAVLVTVGVSVAAPAPRDSQGPYFPIRKGDTRVYETCHGDLKDEHTEVVTGVENRKGTLRVTHGWLSDGEPRNLTTVIVSSEGVFNVIAENAEEQLLAPILKFPLKPGESWVVERGPDPFGTPFLRKTYTVGREEEIEVPAGRYKTFCIECVEEIGDATYRGKQWHSPVVGLVKRIEEEHAETLKSFIRGK